MKFIYSFSDKWFQSLNAPQCKGESIIYDLVEIPLNIEFNKTYYRYYENKLVAFKILAYALYCDDIIRGLSYLVQMPNETPKWIKNFLTKSSTFFLNKEDFFQHQIIKSNVELEWESIRSIMPSKGNMCSSFSKELWYWDTERNCSSNNIAPRISCFVVVDNNAYIYFNKDKQFKKLYLTKEDCIKDSLNGLVIEEFDDTPITIDLKINMAMNTKKVHTLRFIEDD